MHLYNQASVLRNSISDLLFDLHADNKSGAMAELSIALTLADQVASKILKAERIAGVEHAGRKTVKSGR